jgi:Ca-activated chloride channel family protein
MGRFAFLPVVLALATPLYAQQDPVPQLPPAAEPATAAPQAGDQPAQPRIFRSTASMVALTVTVLDGKKPVGGLERQDFEVYEDGVQQSVRFFESRSVPLDVILLLDASSSMGDKMDVVHDAARGFMKMLRDGDRGAVVVFADTVRVIQPLTADAQAIEAAINSTQPKGATSLYNAIYVALKEFGRNANDSNDVRRQAIAVLSDGEDTASLVGFDDVMGLARKTGVSIYTIALQSQFAGLRSGQKKYFSDAEYAMKSLAQETGAQSFFPTAVNELKAVYDAITDELTTQYSIGYSPTNPRSDGRYRRIVVRVGTNPNYRPRTRSGYTAETPPRASSSHPADSRR